MRTKVEMRKLKVEIVVLLSAFCFPLFAHATEVQIPPLLDGAGVAIPVYADVRLVTPDGRLAIGMVNPGLVTEYQRTMIPAEGLTVSLTPQAVITRQDSVATAYAITIRTSWLASSYTIQVPESAEPQRLMDLVGATVGDAP